MPEIHHGTSTGIPETENSDFVDRIVRAYRRAAETPLGDSDSMWLRGPLFEMRREIHEALTSNNTTEIHSILRNPGSTDLLYGFENLTKSFARDHLPNLDYDAVAFGHYTFLLKLCEAVGVRRVHHHDQAEQAHPEIEDALLQLDAYFGHRVVFPNPFPGEIGVATARGIASYRAPPAIYQAWRAWQLVGQLRSPRVVEIGGGLGRTAYYARKFGIQDYTIVDIPMSLVAQANFLGRVIDPEHIQLFGEKPKRGACIKLMPPAAFFAAQRPYDLALNVDSLTEMSKDTARAYCNEIYDQATRFLSINHEGLGFAVAELMPVRFYQRSPYWMRPGYVEELSRRRPVRGFDYKIWPAELRFWRSHARRIRRFLAWRRRYQKK